MKDVMGNQILKNFELDEMREDEERCVGRSI